ncbi:hypothetical protein ACMTN4_22355 [Rhodococcus globerulus]|uniref:hypothetical protein n=1 Tax=Rhodococcus globerulus TaxID=33008 RepID=UPI0039E872CA
MPCTITLPPECTYKRTHQRRHTYTDAIAHAQDEKEVREILVDAICGDSRATERELRPAREMYAYGSISSGVGDLIRAGEAAAIAALAVRFSERAARATDALVDKFP